MAIRLGSPGHYITSRRATYGVKVNHLPAGTTEGQLRALFEVYGEVAGVSIKSGIGEWYAFVNFHSRSCAQTAARELNNTRFCGKTINCRLQGEERRSSSIGEYTVKVTSLPSDITEDTLGNIFSFGDPDCVQGIKINTSTSGPPYAYVNYYSQRDANRAAQLDCSHIGTHRIRVKLHSSAPDSPSERTHPNSPALSSQPSSSMGIPSGQVQRVFSQPTPRRQLSSGAVGYSNERAKCPLRQASAPQPLSPLYNRQSSDLGPYSRSYNPPPPFQPHPWQVAVRREGAPLSPLAAVDSSTVQSSSSVKVSIHGTLTPDDIVETFSLLGELRDAPIIRPGDPPHAFVNFSTPKAAEEACKISTVKGTTVHVKLQAPRKKIEANWESVDVPCTALVATILSSKRQSELERLASKQNVKLTANPSRRCIKVVGARENTTAVKECLQRLLDTIQSMVSSKECELPCHSVPIFKQDSATDKVHEIQKSHGVEFQIVRVTDSSPVDLGLFTKDVKKCFQDESSSDVPKCSDLQQYVDEKDMDSSTTVEPDVPLPNTWLWENDSGTGYIAYTPEITSELNRAYSTFPSGSIDVKIGSFKYKIDFSTMTQINTKTLRSRPIRRTKGGAQAVKWFYEDDRKEFQPFNSDESSIIESTYQSNSDGLQEVNGSFFDFSQMRRLDMGLSMFRKVERRVDVETEDVVSQIKQVLTIQASGLPDGLDPSIEELQDMVEQSAITKDCNLDNHEYSKNVKADLVKNMNQYFVTTELFDDCLKLKGAPNYVERISLKAEQQKIKMMKEAGGYECKIPVNWSPQTKEVMLVSVKRGSKEWKDEVQRISLTLRGVTVVKIERVQSKWLWGRYSFAKNRMDERNKGQINEKHLFHGTRTTPPEKIYRSEKGVDFRHSREGLWGNGAYFAVKASYSNSYAYRLPGGINEKQMFICKVLTGDCYNAGETHDRSMIQPPLKPGQDAVEERYDSVKGHTNGSDVYIVYDHEKVYPAYLVTYRSA